MIVAVTTAVPVLAAVKDGIFPFPLATRPIEDVLLVHAKVVPLTGLLKLIAEAATPLQSERSATRATVGVGLTVMVKVSGVPGTPKAVGVTTTVATTGAVPVLVAVKPEILPDPLAAKPIDGLLLVHVKVVPATGLVNVQPGAANPLQ